MRTSEQIKVEIEEKFGFVPPFFRPAEQNPQVLENLWQQTLSGYVNNPLSPLFKEKLAAYLSRHCAIPYCMICHSCSLPPLGVRAREVLELLEAPPLEETDVYRHFRVLTAYCEQLTVLSNWNSAIEESLLACAVFISLQGESADYYRTELRRLLGTVNYQHLVSFIAYVKTCHIWMESHPEVAYIADKRTTDHLSFLLGDEPGLADFFHHYRERVRHERQRWAEQRAAITQRKQAEEALRQSEEKFRNLVEQTSDWVWEIDRNGVFTYVSPKASEITGYELTEILGKSTFDFMSINEVKRFAEVIDEFISKQQPFTRLEKTLTHKDGHLVVLETSGSPVFDCQGVFQGYRGIARDITERREIERLKDEFVSVVSHELRTPLTSIRGALGLLANGVLRTQPEKGQRMLDIAVNNTDRLVRLINDILDIERIESGKVSMRKQACDAANLMMQSIDAMRGMAEKAGVNLSISPISIRLWADPDRIIQVLTNLLSNAIKFSPQGSTVWLSAEIQEAGEQRSPGAEEKFLQAANSKQILFQVRDQGRGIPADKLETIFERFGQVDASDSRRKGGTGLGLAICRSILQHHGGYIWAESTLGQGSTFFFTLPVLQEEQSADGNTDSDAPLVLVCDDDPSVRTVVQTMLEQGGYQAMTVASGQEAIALSAQQHPDAILLNLMMPGMHGWETLAALKQQVKTKDIPVVILSGLLPDASPHPEVSDWIVKPPDERSLFQALRRAITGQNQNIRVLIVEDDIDLARVLTAMFEHYGIETFYAQTGREAIQLSQSIIPDLLLLDLILPECDGFAVVEWLRQHNRLCQVPLVVYTARDINDADREQLKLGQTLFLTKGRIAPEEFEQRVINLLHRIICHRE